MNKNFEVTHRQVATAVGLERSIFYFSGKRRHERRMSLHGRRSNKMSSTLQLLSLTPQQQQQKTLLLLSAILFLQIIRSTKINQSIVPIPSKRNSTLENTKKLYHKLSFSIFDTKINILLIAFNHSFCI